MKAFRMALSEWRRLTSGKWPTLAVVAIMMIPTLYAGLYLWANRDPYGALSQVKAAVVVQDQPAKSQNSGTIHVGPQIAQNLKGDGSFDWQEVDADTAARGVSDGSYVFSLTIPKNFSAALASTADFNPTRAPLILTTNEANNYLSSTIADQVLTRVTRSIEQNVSEQAASSFLLGFSTIHQQIKKAGEGADQLHTGLLSAQSGAGKLVSGADQLKTGTDTLVDGTGKLVTGSGQLVTGTGQLVTGSGQLADGTSTLSSGADRLATAEDQLLSGQKTLNTGIGTARTGATDLHTGAVKLASGADQVAAGNQQIADIGDKIAGASQTAHGQLDTIRADLVEKLKASGLPEATQQEILAKLDEVRKPLDDLNTKVQQDKGQLDTLASGSKQVATGAHQLVDGSQKLVDGLGTAQSGSNRLVSGQQQARDGAYQLKDGAAKANSGAQQLHSGAQQVDGGARQLQTGIGQADSGARKLQTGAGQLATGARDLQKGLGSAVTGSKQLADGLREGLGSIPDLDQDDRNATANTIASPIKTQDVAEAEAGSYGAGLAPFFCCIGAWVGAYVMFLLVRPLSRRAIAARQGPGRTALAGWLTPAAIAVAQVLVMLTIVVRVVDISVLESIPVLLFLGLTAVTFVAIVHTLNAWLGPVGQLLGLVLLVLQLASAGGTFPWQTLPPALQVVHHVLPMSYAVDGLRHLMYGAPVSEVRTDVLVLAGYLIGSLALTAAAAYRRRIWKVADIKPEIAL